MSNAYERDIVWQNSRLQTGAFIFLHFNVDFLDGLGLTGCVV